MYIQQSFDHSLSIPTIIQSPHSQFLLHCKIFNKETMMLTFGSEGQIHLFVKSNQKWAHRSSISAFQTQITCYDIAFYSQGWRIVAISYDNIVKIIKINNLSVLVEENITKIINNGSPFISCVFDGNTHTIYASTAGGKIYVLTEKKDKWQSFYGKFGFNPVKLIANEQGKIYGGSSTNVYELLVNQRQKQIKNSLKNIIVTQDQIIDLLLSKQQICSSYSTLVVLTKRQIIFYDFDMVKAYKLNNFEVKSQICRIGWGQNNQTVCLYELIDNQISNSIFTKGLEGGWMVSKIY